MILIFNLILVRKCKSYPCRTQNLSGILPKTTKIAVCMKLSRIQMFPVISEPKTPKYFSEKELIVAKRSFTAKYNQNPSKHKIFIQF